MKTITTTAEAIAIVLKKACNFQKYATEKELTALTIDKAQDALIERLIKELGPFKYTYSRLQMYNALKSLKGHQYQGVTLVLGEEEYNYLMVTILEGDEFSTPFKDPIELLMEWLDDGEDDYQVPNLDNYKPVN